MGDDVGPVHATLSSYGYQGKVVGCGVGTFGECSHHIVQLIDLMVDMQCQRQATGTTISPSSFKSKVSRHFITKLGHTIHRGWSKTLLERIPLLIQENTFFSEPSPPDEIFSQ